MLKLKVIGCSSGRPHPTLAGSSYLLMQGDRRILFDIGEGFSSALLRNKIDPLSIETIFISHTHSDHIAGLFLYLQMVHGMRRREPLDIFVPAEVVEPLERWLDATYLFRDHLSLPVEIHAVDAEFEFEMTDLRIRPHLTDHLQTKAEYIREHQLPNQMQCFAYQIEASKQKIVYSADFGSLSDLEPIIAGADLLILEAFHVEIAPLIESALERKIRRILLTHLPESLDRSQVRGDFERSGYTNLLFADEGLEIDLLPE